MRGDDSNDTTVNWDDTRVVRYDSHGMPLRRAAGFTPAETRMASKYHPTSVKPTPAGHPKTGGGRPTPMPSKKGC